MPHRTTVAQLAQLWLAVYISTARTGKNVGMAAQRVTDYLDPFIGERPLTDIRPDDVRLYRRHLEERGLAPRSVRHLLADARCFFNWAVEAGRIDRTPFPRRVMPRIQETAPDRLADEEIARLLAIPEPHAFVIRFGLGTGLRWGELVRATREHVDGPMLVVAQTKSSRLRRVPVAPDLLHEIIGRPGRLVPYSEGGAGSFNKLVSRRSGVDRFHVHQLRHTFACRWLEAGGSLPTLQQILGHKSVVTTQHYARLSDESVRLEAARINGTIASWRGPVS